MSTVSLKESVNKKYNKYWHVFSGSTRAGKLYIEKKDDGSLWLSIFLNKNMQGKGIGSLALEKFCKAYKQRPLFAVIRKSNGASQKVFRKVGFVDFDVKKNVLVLR